MILPGAVLSETGANTARVLETFHQKLSALDTQVSTVVKNGQLVASHANLTNLAYANAGHTGFASASSLSSHTGNVSNPHVVTAAQVSPLTTKGDLWHYAAADARLPIGTDTHILTADSAEDSGMKWAAAPAGGVQESDDPVTWTGQHVFSNATTASAVDVTAGGLKTQYIGIGLSPNSSYPLYTNKKAYFTNYTGFGSAPNTNYRVFTSFLASTSTGTKIANYISATNTSSNSLAMYGVLMKASLKGVGTASSVYGAAIGATMERNSVTHSTGGVTGGRFAVTTTGTNNVFPAQVALTAGHFHLDLQNTTSTYNMAEALKVQLLFDGTTTVVTNGFGVRVMTPDEAGTGDAITTYSSLSVDALDSIPAITTHYGLFVGDLTDVSITNNYGLYLDAQDGANQGAGVGNIHLAGGDWNTGHVVLGAAHVWFDGSNLYGKTSAPSNATDGTDICAAAPLYYSQAAEPASPSAFAFWYEPATGGIEGIMHAHLEDTTGTWAWHPIAGG